jgi:hypothetical protein
MKIVGIARLYQEQHKFDQALMTYRKAIVIARKSLMNEAFRQVILCWLRSSVKACLRKTRAVPDPVYLRPAGGRLLSDLKRRAACPYSARIFCNARGHFLQKIYPILYC